MNRINDKFYTKVCDLTRFADLGLDMTQFKYCNNSLPYEVCVHDLIGRMSLAEFGETNLVGGGPAGGLRRWYATYFRLLAQGVISFATVIVSPASFNETSLWKKLIDSIRYTSKTW